MANRDRFGTRRDPGVPGALPELITTPFGMMRRMADEMNQMFNQGMGAARDLIPFGGGFPSVDVRETAGSYVVEAELPGVRSQDIEVTVKGDVLTLKGQTTHQQERQEQGQGYFMSERRFGSFYREIPLPSPVDENNCSAHFENGVLEIRLPKTGQEQGHRIQVNAGQGTMSAQAAQGVQSQGTGGVSQGSVESSVDNQSFPGETSGKSASDSARIMVGQGSEGSAGGQTSGG